MSIKNATRLNGEWTLHTANAAPAREYELDDSGYQCPSCRGKMKALVVKRQPTKDNIPFKADQEIEWVIERAKMLTKAIQEE